MNRINKLVAETFPLEQKACKQQRRLNALARESRTEKIIKKMRLLFESGYHGYVNKEN